MSETSVLFEPSDGRGASLGVRTILIVDDNRDFAELLSTALDLEDGLRCVGTAATAAEGVRLAGLLQPEMVIMDLQMPGEDGLSGTREIRLSMPDTLVAVLSAHGAASWVEQAAEAGAHAFIVKDGRLPEMVAALRRVHRGSVLTTPVVVRGADRDQPDRLRDPLPVLTTSEHDVLISMSRGVRPRHTARDLGISAHDCRELTKSLHSKLRATSTVQTLSRARHFGLLVAD
jgi:DNA-binding NarL/FixJ family response regulator